MTSRRSFLASLAAAVLGRSLFRKPNPDTGISIRMIRRWDHGSGRFHVRMDVLHGFPGPSLFNPRENVHAQWLQAQHNMLLNAQLDVLKIGAPISVPRPRRWAA